MVFCSKLGFWIASLLANLCRKRKRYDDNRETLDIPNNARISSLDRNLGKINLGEEADLKECNFNAGEINIGDSSSIHVVDQNISNIHIGKNSKVDMIKNNGGVIILGENCDVRKVKNNFGTIVGGVGSDIPIGTENTGIVGIQKVKKFELISAARVKQESIGHGSSRKVCRILQPPSVSQIQIANESGENRSNEAFAVITKRLVTHSLWDGFRRDDAKKVDMDDDSDEDDFGRCVVCFVGMIECAFPCGHVSCIPCGRKLKNCHTCRMPIAKKIKFRLHYC